MSTRLAKPNDSTWESLALARFFLAMVVIAAHVNAFGHSAIMTKVASLSAFTAVVCFLIVSGYSIAHSVHRGTDGFYRRRFLRVYPLYAIGIIVPVAVQAIRGHLLPHQVSNAMQNMLFLQAFTTDPMFLNQVVWTLAIEVVCYAAAPFFVQLSTRALTCIAGVSAACYVVYPQLMIHGWSVPYYAYLPYGGGVLMLTWAWLAGFIYYRHRDSQPAALALALSVFVLLSLNSLYTSSFSNVTIALTIASLALGKTLPLTTLTRKLAAYAGDISFPLYLLHIPLFHLMSGMLHLHSVPLLTSAALATAAAGVFVDNQLKRPVQVIFDATSAAISTCNRGLVLARSTAYSMAIGLPKGSDTMVITPATRLAA